MPASCVDTAADSKCAAAASVQNGGSFGVRQGIVSGKDMRCEPL